MEIFISLGRKSIDRYQSYSIITVQNFRPGCLGRLHSVGFFYLPLNIVFTRTNRSLKYSISVRWKLWIIHAHFQRFWTRIDRAEESIVLYGTRTIYDSSRHEIGRRTRNDSRERSRRRRRMFYYKLVKQNREYSHWRTLLVLFYTIQLQLYAGNIMRYAIISISKNLL